MSILGMFYSFVFLPAIQTNRAFLAILAIMQAANRVARCSDSARFARDGRAPLGLHCDVDMALPYQPKARAVLSCDFFGYIEPEIVKRRPVVVLKAHKTNPKLVVVVPLSTTRPNPLERHHYRLLQNPLPASTTTEVWAKCDLVATVSTERLDSILSGRRRPDGRPEYLNLQISQEQLDAIRRCVIFGLGLFTTQDHELIR